MPSHVKMNIKHDIGELFLKQYLKFFFMVKLNTQQAGVLVFEIWSQYLQLNLFCIQLIYVRGIQIFSAVYLLVILVFFKRAPRTRVHVRHCHHFVFVCHVVMVICVCSLCTFQSFSHKPLDQLESCLVEMLHGWSL